MIIEKETMMKVLRESTDQLISVINEIPEEKFNIKPEENSWSIGQVCEHLWLVENSVNQVMRLKTKTADERDPTKQIELIKTSFQNFEKKFNAFGPIIPSEHTKDKADLTEKLQTSRAILIEIIETNDLGEICLSFKHALFGELSRAEWVYFNLYHSERHLNQIEKIRSSL